MSRRSNRNRRTGQDYQVRPSTDAEINKAQVPGVGAGGQVYTAQQVAALMNAGIAPQTSGGFNALPRLDPQVAFGPGLPLIPAAIDPVRRDSGRPEPRFTDYPVSSNLPGVTDRLVPWKVLRDAAAAGGIPRRCIQIRKDEITTLNWAITVTKTAVARAQAESPHSSRSDIEADLAKRLGPEIARCSAFWERPDPGQDEDWTDWIGKLLEEHLVLDAVAIYPRRTYGGDLYAMEVLDGSTIKVLRDYRGGKPLPPSPSYQQMLWGFPRGEYVADVDTDGKILNAYAPDTLIYKRRNVRTETLYGHSAVEQCLEDLDVWLRRRSWIRAEFTEGTIPSGLLRNTAANGWTPQQVLEYETALNDAWSGQTLERHRMRILPPGFELESVPDVAERYKPEYDLFLLKQLAAHFATTIAELNFTEPGGLGSSGYHEGQADIKERSATMPTYRWIQGLITGISRRHLRMPPELEFRILGLEQEDEAAADAVAQEQVAGGRMTLNEDRDRLGKPRYAFAEADMPMLMTQRGIVFIEGASVTSAPGVLVGPVQAPKDGPDTDSDATAAEDDDSQDDGDSADATKADDPGRNEAVGAELAAFDRWARRNPDPRRPFQFTVLTKADAPHLASDTRALFAADAEAQPPPKGVAPRPWPGRERAKATAKAWGHRVLEEIRDSVDFEDVASAWSRSAISEAAPTAGNGEYSAAAITVTWHSAKSDQSDKARDEWRLMLIVNWLRQQNLGIHAAIEALLRRLWAEGYSLGAHAAKAAATGRDPGWTWHPGDATGARRSMNAEQRAAADKWIGENSSWVDSITAHRLDVLARVLTDAQGLTPTQLASALKRAIGDPTWASTVASTELIRAAMAATNAEYLKAGIPAVEWVTTSKKPCAACQANADAGPLPTGSVFPSGDSAAPIHVGCSCELWPTITSRAAAR